MDKETTSILLDVPMEDLLDILSDDDWDVDTVTKKLGPTKEDRADKNILRYAKETPGCVIVTVDKPFVHRLRAEGVEVIALDLGDRAKIIKEKLHQKFSK